MIQPLPHIHFQDKCISKFSTYNIHLLIKMTCFFFRGVSIPTFTNICEADKIKFEYIFIYYALQVLFPVILIIFTCTNLFHQGFADLQFKVPTYLLKTSL